MADGFSVGGKIVAILDTQQVKETFKKREFVIELPDDKYPQEVKFQVTQDRCTSLDGYKKGDWVTVHFNLRGKSYTDKTGNAGWFTNLECWRIEGNKATQTAPASQADAFDDVPF
jgi:single-strand DNA-binding protein